MSVGTSPKRSTPSGQQARIHTGVLVCFTLLALLLTWPLPLHFTTHVPGDGIDDPALAWNLWWIGERLVGQLDFDIFHADWMFHPVGINLGFYTLTPLNGLQSLPPQLTFGLIPASNLILLSTFVLGGYGTFLLTRYVLSRRSPESKVQSPQSRGHDSQLAHRETSDLGPWTLDTRPGFLLPPIVAGIIYAFASSKLFYASLGQFNIASSYWIPFYVLYLLRTGESVDWRAGRRNARLAALFLIFQAWAELTYASFLLIFTALYCVWWITRALSQRHRYDVRPRLSPGAALLALALLGATFLIGIVPFLWAMVPDLLREGDFFASGGGFADIYSADLMGYLVPTRLHPLLGDWVAGLPFANDVAQHIYIGYSALALAALGCWSLWRGNAAIFSPVRFSKPDRAAAPHGPTKNPTTRWTAALWSASFALFWLLTLGPQVRWAGEPLPIPGPFALVSQLPFFSGNRYPSRYSVMLMLTVAVLAAAGLRALIARWPRPRASVLLTLLVCVLFLGEHLSLPLPLNDSRTPPIYAKLATEPGDFALLELPTGWRNGARVLGRSDELIMMQQWYQTVHGQRRLGGNTSRNPAHKFQYFVEAPLINDWIALMNADQPYITATVAAELETMIERGRAQAPRVLDFLDVQYVTVHAVNHGVAAPPELLRYVDEALPLSLADEWNGTDWTGQPATIRLYRVETQTDPSDAWALDLSTPDGALYLAEGWSALAAEGVRYATRAQPALLLDLPDAGGTLRLQLFGPASGVAVRLNGQTLAEESIGAGDGGQWLEIRVPSGLAVEPVDRLELHFAGAPTSVTALDRIAGGEQPVGETGVALPGGRTLVVRSAGKDVGDFAQIFVDGIDVARHDRGYNLVAVDPTAAAGEGVLESAAFDTLHDPQASDALAAWLAQWPDGTLITGAVQDTADGASDEFYNLSGVAVDALARAGVITDLRQKYRWSHAFIGAVGAPTGTALENAGLLRPASAFVGPPVDGASVSGGIGQVQFGAENDESAE